MVQKKSKKYYMSCYQSIHTVVTTPRRYSKSWNFSPI